MGNCAIRLGGLISIEKLAGSGSMGGMVKIDKTFSCRRTM